MIADQVTLLNQTVLELLNEKNETKIVKAFTLVGLKVLGADFGFVWLNSPSSQVLELVYKSPNVPFIPNPPREGGRNYKAIKSSVPDFITETKATPDAKYVSKYTESFVIIPLVYKEAVYGTMVLCFKKPEMFPKEKRILSTFIGNSVAQAITIGRLVQSEHEARLASERHGAYFRALVENSDEAIFLVDENGKIIYASPSIESIFGHIPENVIGKRIFDFIYKDHPEKITNFLKKAVASPDSTQATDFHYTDKNGAIKTMEAKALNMLNNEHVGGLVLNVRDITERKKAEMLRETEVLLKEEKLKTEFIANATHEFRTPLAIIKGNIDLAMRLKEKEIKPLKNELKSISEEVNHLSSLISDLALITYKMKALQTMIGDKKIDLAKLINKIVKRFKVIAEQKKILIKVKSEESFFVRGDEMYLNKLFLNLIKNSVSYGKQGGWVSVELTKNNDVVDIRVKDDGVGISEEDLPYVFERFYRVDKSHTGVEGGTGLGLAIVKWAVLAHGGTIKVDSKIGKGTTFTVSLPLLK